jgi:GNAT superfamily N-acetyltransferase
MNVRRYRRGEEEALWRLYHDTTHLINGRDYTAEQVERWAPAEIDMGKWVERVRARNPFVAEEDGAILGFAELESDGHIDYFYCHHRWQRKGVGKALFRTLEDEAIRLGIRSLRAEVSVTAREFFASMGFEIVEEQEKIVCGAPARRFLMQKRIAD